jgi:hypothetical protein
MFGVRDFSRGNVIFPPAVGAVVLMACHYVCGTRVRAFKALAIFATAALDEFKSLVKVPFANANLFQ